jgi:hypothetical protein
LKRITPEEVVEAYRKTGIRPATWLGHLSSDKSHGDGMGAYAAANLGVLSSDRKKIKDAFLKSGFDFTYLRGFASGFHGATDASRAGEKVFDLGHADGKDAYAAATEAARG